MCRQGDAARWAVGLRRMVGTSLVVVAGRGECEPQGARLCGGPRVVVVITRCAASCSEHGVVAPPEVGVRGVRRSRRVSISGWSSWVRIPRAPADAAAGWLCCRGMPFAVMSVLALAVAGRGSD
jgi:hypothetical protein